MTNVSFSDPRTTGGFPDPVYWAYIKKQLYDAGVVVPLINNDACKIPTTDDCHIN